MKWYFLFIISLLFIFLNINESYSKVDNSKSVIYPVEVTTKNLKEYVDNNIRGEIIYFCSNDNCYNIKDANINTSIRKFRSIYDKNYTREELEIIDVKGYPITEIGVNIIY